MRRTKIQFKGLGCIFVPFIYFFTGVFSVIGFLLKGIFNLLFGIFGIKLK